MTLDDAKPTVSSEDQHKVERDVAILYRSFLKFILKSPESGAVDLHRGSHASFLLGPLGQLPGGYASGLDAARPWVTFWASHGLCLLGADEELDGAADGLIKFISSCQYPSGGFGGGPYQLPHLAPTYAAVATLINVGTAAALDVVDREKVLSFLQQMCVPAAQGGGMTVHADGEVDIRSCYLALATAYMLGFDLEDLADRSSLVRFIQRCQTYEGGLGGEPGNEAHGGYTYCGLAALVLLCRARAAKHGRADPSSDSASQTAPSPAAAVDVARLEAWAAARQAPVEGGFNGRTGKLADGCYSFWQGALFPLVAEARGLAAAEAAAVPPAEPPSAPGGGCGVPALPDCLKSAAGVCGVEEPRPPTAAWAEWSHDSPAAHRREQHAEHVSCSASLATAPGSAVAAAVDAMLVPHVPPPLPPRMADLRAALAEQDSGLACSSPEADTGSAGERLPGGRPMFSAAGLQMWLMLACQEPSGLRDKPGKSPDFYHTCYCLSGLAVAQQCSGRVLGQTANSLRVTDVCVNVLPEKLAFARRRFAEPVR